MPKIVSQRSGSTPLPNFYSKITTAGDASRFIGSETGRREIHVVASDANGDALVDLDLEYLVGQKQLNVFRLIQAGAASFWSKLLDEETVISSPASVSNALPYFEELSSSTVRLRNLPASSTTEFLFEIPHTAIPAELRERVTIQPQGGGTSIELLGNGDGIRLRSATGLQFVITVDDDGHLTSTPQ